MVVLLSKGDWFTLYTNVIDRTYMPFIRYALTVVTVLVFVKQNLLTLH